MTDIIWYSYVYICISIDSKKTFEIISIVWDECRIYIECVTMSLPIVGNILEMNLFLGCVLLDNLDNFL